MVYATYNLVAINISREHGGTHLFLLYLYVVYLADVLFSSCQQEYGYTLFILAAKAGQSVIAKKLLRAGAKIEAANEVGNLTAMSGPLSAVDSYR